MSQNGREHAIGRNRLRDDGVTTGGKAALVVLAERMRGQREDRQPGEG